MSNGSVKFILRSTATSPFGRKVRMAAEVLGLMDRITLVPANPLDEADTLRKQNPLGKIPCLIAADGTPIYDSGVIIEYLDQIAGGARLIPAGGRARIEALTRARLADGITEAAILVVYEGRFRDPGAQSERWLTHQRGKILRALAAFEAAPPDPAKTDIVAIGAFREALDAGLRVPEDLSVVGFDDIPVSAFIHPSLTTVAVPKWEMGQRAAEVLQSRIQGDGAASPPQRLVLPTTLIVRESTGPPGTSG